MNSSLVDIALPLPLDQLFTYIIPPHLEKRLQRGMRVLIPFGKKSLTGFVIDFPEKTSIKKLKKVIDVLDTSPAISNDLIKLAEWISEYYLAPIGDAFRALMPQGFNVSSNRIVRLISENVKESLPLKPTRKEILISLLKKEGALSISQIQKKLKTKSVYSILDNLIQNDIITFEEEITLPKSKPKFENAVVPTADGMLLCRSAVNEPEKATSLTPKQLALLTTLADEMDIDDVPPFVTDFLKHSGSTLTVLKNLEKMGLATIFKREIIRDTFQNEFIPPPQFSLTKEQETAINSIIGSISERRFKPFLLYGITGSGKTQVYIEVIKYTLSKNRTAIVLVPEISLTPQMVRRFRSHFQDKVAVIHSRMSEGERYDSWRLIHRGDKKIVIGPRSALFSPLADIGLIVVDEEHESSYKQFDSSPRYNARDAAVMRAQLNNAVVVLGSATPSLESYYNACSGKYMLLELPERVDNAKLPSIEIVSMVQEQHRVYEELKKSIKESGKPFPSQLPSFSISALLSEHIEQRLNRKEGVILLQNRRGYAHISLCIDCGYVEKCENCDVSLTFHLFRRTLRCHYCGFVKSAPETCANCGGFNIRQQAFGTQQIQQELQALFPDATILRMDLDTTIKKGSHDSILKRFESQDADILLGTQMVAKGLDFPHVTLVGVISADTQMLLPDFRAAERTFQLLTQVAGRAGRSQLAGEVIIQSLQPTHYALEYVRTHNYKAFYEKELQHRNQLYYPPLSRLVLIEFSGQDESITTKYSRIYRDILKRWQGIEDYHILGPSEAAIPKLRGQFRKHLLIKILKSKDPSGTHLRNLIRQTNIEYELQVPEWHSQIEMTFDVDPQGLL